MVDAHRLAHHLGALGVFLVVLQAHLVERVEHAAMHGLQAVAGIGQRAPDDHAHRVVEIGAAHLLFNIDGDEVGAAVRRRAAFEGEKGILIVWHRVFSGPPEGGEKAPEKAGPDSAGVLLFYPFKEGFSKADMKEISPYFA